MPCRDDWPDPTTKQRRAHSIAKHAAYFANQLDAPVPQYVNIASTQPYTTTSPDRLAKYLCKLINLNEDVLQSLPEDEHSLQLRLWWVQHKKQDRLRELAEQEQQRKDELFLSVMSKLSDEEVSVLKNRFRLG